MGAVRALRAVGVVEGRSGGLRLVHFLRPLHPAHQLSLSAGPLLLQVQLAEGGAAVAVAVTLGVAGVTGGVVVVVSVGAGKFGKSRLAAML